jgi:hypothetical protein
MALQKPSPASSIGWAAPIAQLALLASDWITVRPNKELKLTKPRQNGALQLNSSVRRAAAWSAERRADSHHLG